MGFLFGYKHLIFDQHCCDAFRLSGVSLLSFHFSRIVSRKEAKLAKAQSESRINPLGTGCENEEQMICKNLRDLRETNLRVNHFKFSITQCSNVFTFEILPQRLKGTQRECENVKIRK